MKTKQIIFNILLLIVCNYFAYYFALRMSEYSKPSDFPMVIFGFIFLSLSMFFDLFVIIQTGMKFYDYLGKQ